jgi:hypothetical protein
VRNLYILDRKKNQEGSLISSLSPTGRGEACLPVGRGEGRRNGNAIFPISAADLEGGTF